MNARRPHPALFTGLLLALHAASASADPPDLIVQKIEYVGAGAKHGNCNTARITVYNNTTTPVTADIPVEHIVEAGEGWITRSGTMAGGIGGKMAKTIQLSDVFLAVWAPGPLTFAAVDRLNTIPESNETNNTLANTTPIGGHCAKLSAADASAKKGQPLRFVVTMAPTTDLPASVEYAVTSTTAQAGATCSRGVDYIAAAGRLQFAKNESSKTVEVQTCGQAGMEVRPSGLEAGKSDRKVVVFALGRVNNAEIGRATATGTIGN